MRGRDARSSSARRNAGRRADGLVWHDRSHGPERFWGDFYRRLLRTLRELDGWFGTSGQVVGWFRKRRQIRFERSKAPTAPRRSACVRRRADRPAGDSRGARAGLDVRRCALEWQDTIDLDRSPRPPKRRRISPAMKSVCMLLQNPYDGDVRSGAKAEALRRRRILGRRPGAARLGGERPTR